VLNSVCPSARSQTTRRARLATPAYATRWPTRSDTARTSTQRASPVAPPHSARCTAAADVAPASLRRAARRVATVGVASGLAALRAPARGSQPAAQAVV